MAQLATVAQNRDPARLLDDEEQLGIARCAGYVGRAVEVADPLQGQADGADCLAEPQAGSAEDERGPRTRAARFHFSTTSPLSLTSVSRSAALIFTAKEPPGAAPPPVSALVLSVSPASIP